MIGFGQGKTVEVTDPVSKTTLKIPSLLGFINFLKTAKKANILSTPQLMTLDNQEGELEVGDKVQVHFIDGTKTVEVLGVGKNTFWVASEKKEDAAREYSSNRQRKLS